MVPFFIQGGPGADFEILFYRSSYLKLFLEIKKVRPVCPLSLRKTMLHSEGKEKNVVKLTTFF